MSLSNSVRIASTFLLGYLVQSCCVMPYGNEQNQTTRSKIAYYTQKNGNELICTIEVYPASAATDWQISLSHLAAKNVLENKQINLSNERLQTASNFAYYDFVLSTNTNAKTTKLSLVAWQQNNPKKKHKETRFLDHRSANKTQISLLPPYGGQLVKHVKVGEKYDFSSPTDQVVLVNFKDPLLPAKRPDDRSIDPNKTIRVQDSLVFTGKTPLVLNKQGLHYLQIDEKVIGGRGLLVQNSKFPSAENAQEMLDAANYLMAANELFKYEKMAQKDGAQAALDAFWSSISSNGVSRTDYYARMQTANMRYSGIKPGWMTDMGMVYMVCGQPSRISHTTNSQTWYYRIPGSGEINFEFTYVEDMYLCSYYRLIRSPHFSFFWDGQIRRVRAGQLVNTW